MSCEWTCRHCEVDMTSIADGITWCPKCGKITSVFTPEMMPIMSKMIFDAKRLAGRDVPEDKLKVRYGRPKEKNEPQIKVV